MSAADRIMNVIVYGNPEGNPTFKGKCTTDYDEFLDKVFAHNQTTYECNECGDTGYLIVDAPVYPGEAPRADIGDTPCPFCKKQVDEYDANLE